MTATRTTFYLLIIGTFLAGTVVGAGFLSSVDQPGSANIATTTTTDTSFVYVEATSSTATTVDYSSIEQQYEDAFNYSVNPIKDQVKNSINDGTFYSENGGLAKIAQSLKEYDPLVPNVTTDDGTISTPPSSGTIRLCDKYPGLCKPTIIDPEELKRKFCEENPLLCLGQDLEKIKQEMCKRYPEWCLILGLGPIKIEPWKTGVKVTIKF